MRRPRHVVKEIHPSSTVDRPNQHARSTSFTDLDHSQSDPPPPPSPVVSFGSSSASEADALHPPSVFDFPTLHSDGSVPDLRRVQLPHHISTPPAALSSHDVKAKMTVDQNLFDSFSSLSDHQYDMVDDASEFSTDDHETASLASTEHHDSGDDADGSIVDLQPELDRDVAELQASDATFRNEPAVSDNLADEQEEQRANSLIDEYDGVKDDNETPSQSTFRASPRLYAYSPPTENDEEPKRKTSNKASSWTLPSSALFHSALSSALFFTVVMLLALFFPTARNPADDVAFRRRSLSTAVLDMTNSTATAAKFDLVHLVPDIGTAPWHQASYRGQGVAPNYIIISMPRNVETRSILTSTWVSRASGPNLTFHLTPLIDGVYGITLPPKDAWGALTVNSATRVGHTPVHLTYTHDFGSWMFQRHTYGRARTDLSRTVTADLTLARHTARSLTHKLADDLAGVAAHAAATTNATALVVRALRRELHALTTVATRRAARVPPVLARRTEAWARAVAVLASERLERSRLRARRLAAALSRPLSPSPSSPHSPLTDLPLRASPSPDTDSAAQCTRNAPPRLLSAANAKGARVRAGPECRRETR